MTYQEKKARAREKAIDISLNMYDEYLSISWGELQEITDKLYAIAKRYGLVREFRENGLI